MFGPLGVGETDNAEAVSSAPCSVVEDFGPSVVAVWCAPLMINTILEN